MALPIRKKAQIQTARLVLKPHTARDTESLIALLTDPDITRTFMVPDFTSRLDMEKLANALISFSQPSDTTHLQYGIYLHGELIGFVCDCDMEDDTIEIGYVIFPRFQGRGYATEATQAVLAELREMGFKKVTAGYFAENTASLRVMEKCGMQPTDITDEAEYRGKHHLCKYCEICFV
ncbi:GNAT family N-acetyltransferase [Gemmiger sp.]